MEMRRGRRLCRAPRGFDAAPPRRDGAEQLAFGFLILFLFLYLIYLLCFISACQFGPARSRRKAGRPGAGALSSRGRDFLSRGRGFLSRGPNFAS